MSFEQSSPSALPKNRRGILIAVLAVLFIAAAAGALGPLLAVLSLGVIALGVVALIRGHLPRLKIANRRTATGVLLFGVYLLFFGAVLSMNNDGVTPVAAATGDSCEVVGAIHEEEVETFYCTPSSSGELALASAADFNAYQDAQTEEREAKAKEEAEEAAQTASEELEKDLAAAEKRAENAEAKVEEYKEQLEEEQAATAQAEEAAATAQTDAEQERQSQPAPTQNAPAPAPAPKPDSNNTGVSGAYKNCTEARNAGAAPVYRGDPGYGSHLDRDGDGVGCE